MTERRPDPVRDDGLHVFVPALMGVGMIVSGILVLADWLQKLLPSGRLRRRQQVSNGAKGVVVGIAEAAGYEIDGPDFRQREWRPRWNYLVSTFLFGLMGGAALAAGLLAFNDDAGLFYRNPWMVGLGVGAGSVLGLIALQLLFFGTVYRRSFRAAHVLVETTWFGGLKPPPTEPAEFARLLRLVPRGGKT